MRPEVETRARGLQGFQKRKGREIAVAAADLDAEGAAQVFGELVQKGFPPCHQDEVHAAFRQRTGVGGAEALRGAGNQRPGAVALREPAGGAVQNSFDVLPS